MSKKSTTSLEELKMFIMDSWGEEIAAATIEKKGQQRREVWNNPDCKKLYQKLLKFAGGSRILSAEMKGEAKHMAINCFVLGKEPDYQKFKDRVKKHFLTRPGRST